ncbi:MAG: DUF3857 domain-containing protein [Candidatus Omnitrophota bacterium]
MKERIFRLISKTVCLAVSLFAIFLFPASLSASPQSDEVWRLLIRRGDIDGALKSFEQIIADDPKDALAQAGAGMLLDSRASEKDALDSLLNAMRYETSTPEAVLYLFEAMKRLSGKADYEKFLQCTDEILQSSELSSHWRECLQYGRTSALKRLGRWEEAKTSFSQLGFLARFWYCGPFDNAEKGGHARVFGPEEDLRLEATYPGRYRETAWRPLPLEPYDGYINLHALVSPSQESSVYLAASILSQEAQRCKLAFGHAGALKVWLNGKLIADINRYHGVRPDQVNIEDDLDAGSNTLLLKVSSGEKGKFGVFVRVLPDKPEMVEIADPAYADTKPDLKAHTPRPNQESPAVFNQEPISLQQMRALSEAKDSNPLMGVFYVLLIQHWDIADENDPSVSAILTQLNTLFNGNPFLMRLLGDAEKQDNRQRLAYAKALEYDTDDRASFLRLLRYYRQSPYATKGLDLIRQWDENHDLPSAALLDKARILNGKGLREAAVDIVRSIAEAADLEAKNLLLDIGGFYLTEADTIALAKEILEEDASSSTALKNLRDRAIRDRNEADLKKYFEQERWLNPFSIAGWLDLARSDQARGEYEQALKTVKEAMQISPQEYELHRIAAESYHLLGKDKEALASLGEAAKSRPSDPWRIEYQKFLKPEEETYSTPYLKNWQDIEIPAALDLSRANFVTLLHQEIVKVHPNGNASETIREAVKILTDSGVKMLQTRGVSYEGGGEEIRVVKARVWKPDGTFLDAPAPQRRSAASAADAAQRLYGDYNVAIFRFPALEKGSVLEWEYEKKKAVENIYADYFGYIYYVGDGYLEPTVHSEFALITPKSRDFYWKYIPPNYPASVAKKPEELAHAPEIIESETERVYHWTYSQLPTIPREPYMPAATEILPYIKISTFKTWQDMTKWYWDLSRDQFITGPVVKDRVKRILDEYRQKHGFKLEEPLSDWDKVKAVNAWVNTGVRYLGLEFGIHGYKPHKVDEICNAQYGDCKDKAALAVAMLGELGIEANFVIVRTTHLGEFDYDLPMLGMFNHAIYYLPNINGKETWIDGTATFFGAAEIPWGDAGANTLIVKPSGDSEFKRIPYSKEDENGGVYTTEITLDADGDAKGRRGAQFRGLYNPVIRSTYENPAKAKEVIDRSLIGTYPGSQSSNIQLSDLQDYDKDESLSYDLEIPQLGVKQGNRLAVPSTIFDESLSQRYAQLSEREYDLVLQYPWTRTNILRIALPPNFSKADLPKDQNMETEFGRYTRKTELKDGVVNLEEELVFRPIRVPKEKYNNFREFCRLVDQYQDEKIFVETN